MDIKEQIISFKTAKLAKEKGFNKSCNKAFINYYSEHYNGKKEYQLQLFHPNIYNGPNPVYLAPTQSLLQRWIREEYNIIIVILPWKNYQVGVNATITFRPMLYNIKTYKEYTTYEKALEVSLYQALKLVKLK